MNVKERIEAFNGKNPPFYIAELENGKFSLCLPLGLISGEYEDFGQKAFEAYALEVGEPPMDSRGFRSHGDGYEWEAAFRQAFDGDPNLRRFVFDCEAGGFFMDSYDLSLLEEYGAKFRAICMDDEKFTPIVSQGIKNMEKWWAEQEKLMKTVRGALLRDQNATFDIMTPDGNIRITPPEIKQLLDGDMQYVHIGGAKYCADELLEQEIVQQQRDLFDEALIRMKTQEPQQEQEVERKEKSVTIRHIDPGDLRKMYDQEGLILQGCGGDPQEWLDGINGLLTEEGILQNGSRFQECSVFRQDNLTCILFPLEGVDANIGKLSLWRIGTHHKFGGTWLSDFVENRLGGFEPEQVKPDCPLIGENGNIFNLMAIAGKTLRQNGMEAEAKKMTARITGEAKSYHEALAIMGEYVNITSGEEESMEMEEMKL